HPGVFVQRDGADAPTCAISFAGGREADNLGVEDHPSPGWGVDAAFEVDPLDFWCRSSASFEVLQLEAGLEVRDGELGVGPEHACQLCVVIIALDGLVAQQLLHKQL